MNKVTHYILRPCKTVVKLNLAKQKNSNKNRKFAPQTALSPFAFSEGRKVRTPQSSIAGNARHFVPRDGGGQVQQKVCTGNAVVKPGKLYAVKFQVYQHLRVTRPLLKGRKMELMSNCEPR